MLCPHLPGRTAPSPVPTPSRAGQGPLPVLELGAEDLEKQHSWLCSSVLNPEAGLGGPAPTGPCLETGELVSVSSGPCIWGDGSWGGAPAHLGESCCIHRDHQLLAWTRFITRWRPGSPGFHPHRAPSPARSHPGLPTMGCSQARGGLSPACGPDPDVHEDQLATQHAHHIHHEEDTVHGLCPVPWGPLSSSLGSLCEGGARRGHSLGLALLLPSLTDDCGELKVTRAPGLQLPRADGGETVWQGRRLP